MLHVRAIPTYRLYRLYNESIVVCFGYYKFTKIVTLLPGNYNQHFSWRANMWERAPLHAFLTALLQKCILVYATVIVSKLSIGCLQRKSYCQNDMEMGHTVNEIWEEITAFW